MPFILFTNYRVRAVRYVVGSYLHDDGNWMRVSVTAVDEADPGSLSTGTAEVKGQTFSWAPLPDDGKYTYTSNEAIHANADRRLAVVFCILMHGRP